MSDGSGEPNSALARFEPLVREYFEASFPAPTPVQNASWPLIAARKHVLITAPTGSGKTLTAFLWALNKFASGELKPGVTSVVYISPLKALNNDIRENLLEPLAALQKAGQAADSLPWQAADSLPWQAAGALQRQAAGALQQQAAGAFPKIRVQTRSGDTPQSERQRMLRRPPEILLTTPESLSLILTSVRGRQMLGHVDTLILDEVHSIVNNRRGVQLLCALERLCWMGLDPQRIALSATVKPLERIARQVAGFSAPGVRRPIETVRADQQKVIDFRVRLPVGALESTAQGKKIWEPLTEAFKERLQVNSSTLLFTNSRRLAEKITLNLNQDSSTPLAYAHHGSLAKDIRLAVEQKLKNGNLRAIVATSSLEMGIDIGNLDEVILVQSPPSVSAALQRIGRSGHKVGEVSTGTLYPTHAHDFLEAAALGMAINARDIEPLEVTENPLDLLAQLIIATTASEDWDVDELFQMLTRAAPYESLRRDLYDGVIEMLAGRYAGMRIRDLQPRITFDRLNNRIRATRGAVMAYYSSGGTIPDRGYFKLRHAGSGQVIGELDEEFVWEATIGQVFNLGAGHWQIQRITHDDVLVNPAPANVIAPPFWRSESVNRDFHFSSYIAGVLDRAERALNERQDDALAQALVSETGFDAAAAAALVDYLKRQRAHSGVLPGRKRILLERINTGPAGYRSSGGERQLVIHTFWGARVNRPFGLALGNAWQEHFGETPELQADNDAIILALTRDIEPQRLISMVTADNLHRHLRAALEDSDFFGARFRECAGRALLLTRKKFNRRLPLWMTRLQSKKLLTATRQLTDFPILVEAWRSCLDDEFDLPNLIKLLTELQDGEIDWRYTESAAPSPFAANLSWNQINRYMYADDTPETRGRSNLQDDLITSAFLDRPSVTREVIDEFLAKRQRLHPDYLPEDDAQWLEWIKERVLLPAAEVPPQLHSNRLLCSLVEGQRSWLCHAEHAHSLAQAYQLQLDLTPTQHNSLQHRADDRDLATYTQELLSFYGPLSHPQLEELLPAAAVAVLQNATFLVVGALVRDDPTEMFCDAENFEILLRFQRRASKPAVEPKSIGLWSGWVAHWQNAGRVSADDALDYLRGYSAPVRVWLYELLPPRAPAGQASELVRAFVAQDMGWVGTGAERICIDYAEELAGHIAPKDAGAEDPSSVKSPLRSRFKDQQARYAFTALMDAGSDSAEAFNSELWSAVWMGELSSDSLDTLIVADRANYKLSGHSSSRRARRVSWPGTWSLIKPDATSVRSTPNQELADESGPLEQLEAKKRLARTLFERYGVLCRELANREGGAFRWRNLFPALRVMELSGEIVAGVFFNNFSGPQFSTPAALGTFVAPWTARDAWLSALDPVSPCGMGLDWPDYALPHRRLGNHLALVAGELALLSENNGTRLTFLRDSDTPATQKAIHLMSALCEIVPRVKLLEINGEKARSSRYLRVIEQHFQVHGDHKGVYLEKSL